MQIVLRLFESRAKVSHRLGGHILKLSDKVTMTGAFPALKFVLFLKKVI